MKKQKYNPEIHHRRSIRLKGHDYAGGGLYFVTLCTKNRRQLFGQLENGKMRLSGAGHIAKECWQAIPEHFPGVVPGVLAVMPDHVHGLVEMPVVGAKDFSPIPPTPIPHTFLDPPARPPAQKRPRGTSRTLGSVVRGFKVGVTKWVRNNTDIHEVWHRNYYETIVRTREAEENISRFILQHSDKLYLPHITPGGMLARLLRSTGDMHVAPTKGSP